ncbi:S16 family serine protease [Myxococcota bacterium]
MQALPFDWAEIVGAGVHSDLPPGTPVHPMLSSPGEVLLPADNLKEAEGLPQYILEKVKLTPVSTIDQVLGTAFAE